MPAMIESWLCLAPAICHLRQAQAGARRTHAPQETSKYDSGSTPWPLLLGAHGKERPAYTPGAQGDTVVRTRELQIPECHGLGCFGLPRPGEGMLDVLGPTEAALRKPTVCIISAVLLYDTHNPHAIKIPQIPHQGTTL